MLVPMFRTEQLIQQERILFLHVNVPVLLREAEAPCLHLVRVTHAPMTRPKDTGHTRYHLTLAAASEPENMLKHILPFKVEM